MRALIGVDGSPESFAAVQFTSRLLAGDKDELILYYSPPPAWLRAVPDSSGTASAAQSFLSNAVFEKARQHVPPSLLPKLQTIIGTHEPRRGLLVAADDRRVDLIAVGARGAGPLTAASIGTIARHVVHHATIPVLVVRGSTTTDPVPLRVLFASDGSEISKHAAEILQLISWPPSSTGKIISVLESLAYGHVPGWLIEQLDDEQLASLGMGPFEHDENYKARKREEAFKFCGTLPSIFRCDDTLVVAGHASEKILEAADMNEINLIILGARKQGALRRALLGSTSEKVLTQATCSVLIVPEHDKP